jgi:hypothetical protein
MPPPIFPPNQTGNEAQQFLHRARMFKQAADKLVAYTNAEQNWPRYALLLHATELTLKGFTKQCEMHGAVLGQQPHNHDLQAWYDLAVGLGLKDDPSISHNIQHLTDIHFAQLTRYPQQRSGPIPDLSTMADETIEYLIQTITPFVNPR